MARLNDDEFREFLEELRSHFGTGALQSRLTRTNTLVSRRSLARPEAMRRQLYQMTIGLERETPATRVLLALWEERLTSGIERERGERLESIADRINECLDDRNQVDPARRDQLRGALEEYGRELREAGLGAAAVRLTMLVRAVPSIARHLREGVFLEEGPWHS